MFSKPIERLLLVLFILAVLILVTTGCGLGVRIEPNGMTFKWDWPDNISSVVPEKKLSQPRSLPTPLAPTG